MSKRFSKARYHETINLIESREVNETIFLSHLVEEINKIRRNNGYEEAQEKCFEIFLAIWRAVRIKFKDYPEVCRDIVKILIQSGLDSYPKDEMTLYFASKHKDGANYSLDEILSYRSGIIDKTLKFLKKIRRSLTPKSRRKRTLQEYKKLETPTDYKKSTPVNPD